VIRTDHDPGYLGLLRSQTAAIPFVPNLFAQDAVIRDLPLWPVLHQPFEPLAGTLLLLLEAACVGVPMLAAATLARCDEAGR
jgi:hypothetical protein